MATLSIRLSDDDKAALETLATDCGHEGNLTAFIRAIARGDVPISDQGNLTRRLDKLSDRLAAVEQQQRADAEKLTDALLKMHGYGTAPHELHG